MFPTPGGAAPGAHCRAVWGWGTPRSSLRGCPTASPPAQRPFHSRARCSDGHISLCLLAQLQIPREGARSHDRFPSNRVNPGGTPPAASGRQRRLTAPPVPPLLLRCPGADVRSRSVLPAGSGRTAAPAPHPWRGRTAGAPRCPNAAEGRLWGSPRAPSAPLPRGGPAALRRSLRRGHPPLPSPVLRLRGVSLSPGVSLCCHLINWAARPSASQLPVPPPRCLCPFGLPTPRVPPHAVSPLPPPPLSVPPAGPVPLSPRSCPRVPSLALVPPSQAVTPPPHLSPRRPLPPPPNPRPRSPIGCPSPCGRGPRHQKARPAYISARPRGRGGSPVAAGVLRGVPGPSPRVSVPLIHPRSTPISASRVEVGHLRPAYRR